MGHRKFTKPEREELLMESKKFFLNCKDGFTIKLVETEKDGTEVLN